MKTLFNLTIILILLTGTGYAGEKGHFAGTWEPPRALLQFWAPIDDSWWNPEDNRRLITYCKDYAKRSDPVRLLPDIIKDLRANPSVEREIVYVCSLVLGTKKLLPVRCAHTGCHKIPKFKNSQLIFSESWKKNSKHPARRLIKALVRQ